MINQNKLKAIGHPGARSFAAGGATVRE